MSRYASIYPKTGLPEGLESLWDSRPFDVTLNSGYHRLNDAEGLVYNNYHRLNDVVGGFVQSTFTRLQ